jgi:DEAD/DEAH box helicase domain-containing protein
MAISIYKSTEYNTTSEREFFAQLTEELIKEFDTKYDEYIFIGNLNCGGQEIDAVFIKNDAIIVIDFKNYSGKVNFSENGNWTAGEIIVKGGSGGKNPYQQLKANKFALLNQLNTWFNKENVNLGHISAIVLFHKSIEIDLQQIPAKINSWFHIVDFKRIIQKLSFITSTSISYTNKDLLALPKIFNLEDQLVYKTKNIIAEPITKNEIKSLKFDITETLNTIGYKSIFSKTIPSREGLFKDVLNLKLTDFSNRVVEPYGGKVYQHQYEAIELIQTEKNVCITTSTSSGKTLIFHLAALELLAKNPEKKVLAIYPLKALGNEQEKRWKDIIEKSKSNFKVTRIDGNIDTKSRPELISNSSIICVTPDIIHAYLLGNIDKKEIRNFFKNLGMIIVDEVHTYRGVFGSNSAFLFRRINHAVNYLSNGKTPQYICASATIDNPDLFLEKLTGFQFEFISNDTAPKNKVELILVDPIEKNDELGLLCEMIKHFANNTDLTSITFVDNRKLVEQLGSIVQRVTINEEEEERFFNVISDAQILPFRSGYEPKDSEEIQRRLSGKELRGIISTSALEMGIDIEHLDLGILFGIPTSSTSFRQRIGRVGRKKDGYVIIVNDGSIRSQTIFSNPSTILEMPPLEAALYLENERLQYIHALCLVNSNGEGEQVKLLQENVITEFQTKILFPNNFIELCVKEINNIVPEPLSPIRLPITASNKPNNIYPLRDLEKQYGVIDIGIMRNPVEKGNLSHSQVIREAYPGAVFYYMGNPFRVKRIDEKNKKIEVAREKKYYTKPTLLINLYPDIQRKNYGSYNLGELKLLECFINVKEKVIGYKERKGNTETVIDYPTKEFRNNFYTRDYHSTGVIIHIPIFNILAQESKRIIASLIFEMFLAKIPFEPQDVGFEIGKFNKSNAGVGFKEDDCYICVFDRTYGSLRLTSRLMELDDLRKVFSKTKELVESDDKYDKVILDAISQLNKFAFENEMIDTNFDEGDLKQVYKIGTQIKSNKDGKIYRVMDVRYSAKKQQMVYKSSVTEKGARLENTLSDNEVEAIEETEFAFYDLDNGEYKATNQL